MFLKLVRRQKPARASLDKVVLVLNIKLTGNTQCLSLFSVVPTLRARDRVATTMLNTFTMHMVFTETYLYKNQHHTSSCHSTHHLPCTSYKCTVLVYCTTYLLGSSNIVTFTSQYKFLHFRFSDSTFWQLAWCSNWSSSHNNSLQKGH